MATYRTTSHATSRTTSTAYTAYRNTSEPFTAYKNTTTTFNTSRSTNTIIGGPLPASGTITMTQIRDCFLMTGAVSLSDFYGLGTPAVPASGTISMSDFYGVSNQRSTTTTFSTSRTTSTAYTAYRTTSTAFTAYKNTTTSYTTSYLTDTYWEFYQPSCFPAGTPVWMADGTTKPIEDVKVGDRLMNGYGDFVEVLGYDRPKLGNRPIYRINKNFYNTPEHLTWTRKGWAVFDFEAYRRAEYKAMTPVTDESGNSKLMLYVGVDPKDVSEYTTGDEIGFNGGYKKIESIEEHHWHPDTQLYALVTTGSRTLMVGDGYVVSGWANDEEFDYSDFG